MSLDAGPIAHLAAELMDELDERYDDDELTLEDAIVVAEFSYQDGTLIRWKGTTDRATVNAGFGAQLVATYVEGEAAD